MKEIPLFKVFMSEEAPEEVGKVLRSGYIGQGPKVDEFEAALQEEFQAQHVVTVNSATSAEHLIFHMLGLDRGTEVLTTAQTCTATNWPIIHAGLRPKWVDINPATFNMDLTDLERKVTPNTKVVYLTHWGGYPNDLDAVEQICVRTQSKFGFRPVVIEDCAHAFGSRYKDKPIGSHGNFCTFSFQAIKHLTTGDGGALVFNTRDVELNARARRLRWYGIDRDEKGRSDFRCESPINEAGFKYHMNDIAATIGLSNLPEMVNLRAIHRANAQHYDNELCNFSGVTLLEREKGFDSAFWIYSLLVEDRAGFHAAMKSRGIIASQVHERNDIHPCMSEFKAHLPSLDANLKKLTHIPVGWWVTEEDCARIVSEIKKGW